MDTEPDSGKGGNRRFSDIMADLIYKSGAPYRWSIDYFFRKLKPFLDRIEDDYVNDAIRRNHADKNPELKELLEKRIRARPSAHGEIMDVVDAIPRTIVRGGAAVGLGVAGNIIDGRIHNKEAQIFKWIGLGAAVSLFANQVVELFRSLYRLMAGMQGNEAEALRMYAQRQAGEKPDEIRDRVDIPVPQHSDEKGASGRDGFASRYTKEQEVLSGRTSIREGI